MLTASPSPRLNSSSSLHEAQIHQPEIGFLSPHPRPRGNSRTRGTKSASPIVKPHSTHVYETSPRYPTSTTTQGSITQSTHSSFQCSATQTRPDKASQPVSVRSISTQTSPIHPSRSALMVDAQTQYSPPKPFSHPVNVTHDSTEHFKSPTPAAAISGLQISERDSSRNRPQSDPGSQTSVPASTSTARTSTLLSTASSTSRSRFYDPVLDAAMPSAQMGTTPSTSTTTEEAEREPARVTPTNAGKRNHSFTEATQALSVDDVTTPPTNAVGKRQSGVPTPSKKMRPEETPAISMPLRYEFAETRDLVVLISSMLMELIRYNDTIPLRDGALTRFHSRAPPGISVLDYLNRLTTHATLSPPILLSMVYYIDKLCALYPAFTISSLTVHRFLITAATVASKGLSDSFWTNKTYARVGGVSIKELALLELEFLIRVQWKIVPQPEVLIDYYNSLVERSPGYEMEESQTQGQDGTKGTDVAEIDGAQKEAG